jgi:hypothetical protein
MGATPALAAERLPQRKWVENLTDRNDPYGVWLFMRSIYSCRNKEMCDLWSGWFRKFDGGMSPKTKDRCSVEFASLGVFISMMKLPQHLAGAMAEPAR